MDYDLIIIGGGPGGYVAADRAGSRGKRVLLIEREQLGGLCLNAGCIPSKALLASAKLYASLRTADRYGVLVEPPRFDLSAAMARKDKIVASLRDGIAYQMSRRNVTVKQGEARLINRHTVQLGAEQHHAAAFILATGASHSRPNITGIDALHVGTLSDALSWEALPASVAILGADALALGVGMIYMLLGVNVSFVSEAAGLLPDLEPEIVGTLKLELRAARFYFNHTVKAIGTGTLTIRSGEQVQMLDAERVIYSAGRAPNIAGFAEIGIDVGSGYIHTDDQMRTNLPGVYAVGDVTARSMWAHAAARMAEVAVNHLTGIPDRFRVEQVPSVVYTYPEVASVGHTEASATQAGYKVRAARLPLNANGRFLTEYEDKRGMCKLVIDMDTNALLGASILAPNASELIAGPAVMIADEFRVQDVQALTLVHPTMSELYKDALYEL